MKSQIHGESPVADAQKLLVGAKEQSEAETLPLRENPLTHVSSRTRDYEESFVAPLHEKPQTPAAHYAQLVAYLKEHSISFDPLKLKEAYLLAKEAHKGCKRISGEDYIIHPLAVTMIVAEIGLGDEALIAALLHDVVEDSPVNIDDIQKQFGRTVATLVSGLTKIKQLRGRTPDRNRQELRNVRKFLLAIHDDIRVLIIKLADRLHNMRTLKALREEKRKRIAQETLDLFAPLAERIGMRIVKDELEHLAFQHISSHSFQQIDSYRTNLIANNTDIIEKSCRLIQELLKKHGISALVKGRIKTPYSIYNKMRHKGIPFTQIADIIAFRVLVPTDEECYAALGVIHSHFKIIAGRFKDYMSVPKLNGYRSIHTGVFDDKGNRLEIQVRTHRDHQTAEYGIAAHWSYKQGDAVPQQLMKNNHFIENIIQIFENEDAVAGDPKDPSLDSAEGLSAEEKLQEVRRELTAQGLFCLTPQGDVIELTEGASIIEFAYNIHTQVGFHAVGAKVNGILQPLRSQLKNGDMVQVITDPKAIPSFEWLQWIKSPRIRSTLRRQLKAIKRDELIDDGWANLQQKMKKQHNITLRLKDLEPLVKKLKRKNTDHLLLDFTMGHLSFSAIEREMFPPPPKESLLEEEGVRKGDQAYVFAQKNTDSVGDGRESALLEIDLDVEHYISQCCMPLPGDPIHGMVTRGHGISIHKSSCPNIRTLIQQKDPRVMPLHWRPQSETLGFDFRCLLHVQIQDTQERSLDKLYREIKEAAASPLSIRFNTDRDGILSCMVEIKIKDRKTLAKLIQQIRSMPETFSVERVYNK